MKSKKSFPRKKIGASKRPAKADSPKSDATTVAGTALNIPPILLEDDQPVKLSISGPGERFALGPTPPEEKFSAEDELPEAYGTGSLLLTARDPHWLYAHWDLTRLQQRHYNSLSQDGHLVLRVHQVPVTGRAFQEVHVHPESRHWFIHVAQAGTKYAAELGYYNATDKWVSLSTSRETNTPPDSACLDTTAEFTSIPLELPMGKLKEIVNRKPGSHLPLARALQELQAEGNPLFPPAEPVADRTPDQTRTLAEMLYGNPNRTASPGSINISELISRGAVPELGEISGFPGEAGIGSPSAAWGTGISSPQGGAMPEQSFWFKVNAELVIYGATEPTAEVKIGGREIKLRPDGSFSYRFALPDGKYELPVTAISADKTDCRAAVINFSRDTQLHGPVGKHPQDPALKPPDAAHL